MYIIRNGTPVGQQSYSACALWCGIRHQSTLIARRLKDGGSTTGSEISTTNLYMISQRLCDTETSSTCVLSIAADREMIGVMIVLHDCPSSFPIM